MDNHNLPERSLGYLTSSMPSMTSRPRCGSSDPSWSGTGGGVALLHAAERRSSRAVISIDGAYARHISDPPPSHAGEDEIRGSGFGRTITAEEFDRISEALPIGPARTNLRRAHRMRADGRFERRPSAEFVLAMSRFAATLEAELTPKELYSAIGCPTLLVCCERGWIQGKPLTHALQCGVNALPASFPHVEIAWLDSGHMIHWERPRELVEVITAFARRT